MKQIILGRTYKDRQHGFQGVAVARTQYLTQCDKVTLETILPDGKLVAYAFDTPLVDEVAGIADVKVDEALGEQNKPSGPDDPRTPSLTR